GGVITPIAAGDGVDQVDLTIPATALDALPPGQASTELLALLAMCAGGAPTFTSNAILCPVGDPILAFKRITVSRSPSPNQNPSIASVLLGGNVWDPAVLVVVPASSTLAVEVDPGAGSAEPCDPATTGCPATGT